MTVTARSSKEAFCEFCHLLYDRHLVSGVGGNIALRTGDRVHVTPSGHSLRDIKPNTIVTLTPEGLVMKGDNPTKDLEMHLRVLRARADIDVVSHVHGANIVAVSAMLEPGLSTLPPLTPGFVYYAYPLPMIPFMAPGTPELAETVANELSPAGRRALLLQSHGLVLVGKDFNETINIAEEIDEAASIFLLTSGNARALPQEELDKIG